MSADDEGMRAAAWLAAQREADDYPPGERPSVEARMRAILDAWMYGVEDDDEEAA